jgi:hypothetical protein
MIIVIIVKTIPVVIVIVAGNMTFVHSLESIVTMKTKGISEKR